VSSILVIEDEPAVADFLKRGLGAHCHSPVVTDEPSRAIGLALGGEFDVILLDLGLPGGDGLDVLSTLRERGQQVPVIVLTGQVEERDAVACLEAGADDYMTKPFRFDELLARVGAVLRRVGRPRDLVLQVGDLQLDLRTRRATLGDHSVDLTSREFALLEAFMRHPDEVLSREQLLSQVWGYFFDPGTNSVNVYVAFLRKKLGAETIETVRGTGYRLRTVETSSVHDR
jgi:DNA-binding response OmpR family regulator